MGNGTQCDYSANLEMKIHVSGMRHCFMESNQNSSSPWFAWTWRWNKKKNLPNGDNYFPNDKESHSRKTCIFSNVTVRTSYLAKLIFWSQAILLATLPMTVSRRNENNRRIYLQNEFHEDQKVTHDCKLLSIPYPSAGNCCELERFPSVSPT